MNFQATMQTAHAALTPLPSSFVVRFRHARISILCCALALAVVATATASAAPLEIEVSKSNHRLVVRSGEEVLKVFHVAVGRGGEGSKQQQGDQKTPVGNYRIIGFNDRSQFEIFIRLNYPNVEDAFYGLRNGVINRDEFDRIVRALRAGQLPPQNTELGGAIGIHGIGIETPDKIQIHDQLDWTNGCIALRNEEVHELRSFLSVGTRVVIKE